MKKVLLLLVALALIFACSCSSENNISGNYKGSIIRSKQHDIEMEKLGFERLTPPSRKRLEMKLNLTQKGQDLSGILIITEKRKQIVAEAIGTFIDDKITIIGNSKNMQFTIILSGTQEGSSLKGKAKLAADHRIKELTLLINGKQVQIPRPDFEFVLNKQQ